MDVTNPNYDAAITKDSDFLTDVNAAIDLLKAKHFPNDDVDSCGLVVFATDTKPMPGNPDSLMFKNFVTILGPEEVLVEGVSQIFLVNPPVSGLVADCFELMNRKIVFGDNYRAA